MATRTVTGTVLRPNGAPWAGALLYVKLIDDTFTESPPETFPPATIAYAAGDDGVVTMELVADLDQPYRVYLPSREYFDILVPAGEPVALEFLRAAYNGSPVTAVDHISATVAHGATGAVVGTTNTQTLTNKTLESPLLVEEGADPQYQQGFDLSALTANRTLYLPDGDVSLTPGTMLPVYNPIDHGIISEEDGQTAAQVTPWNDLFDLVFDAGGGIIDIPAGTYVTGSLILRGNTWLRGAGVGKTTLRKPSGNANMMNMGDGETDIRVTDLTIDNRRDDNWGSLGSGLSLTANRRVYVQRVEIKNVMSYGMGVSQNATHDPIRDCLFEDIWIHHIGGLDINGTPLWNGDGIDAKLTANCTWRNIRLEDIHNVGADIRGQEDVLENIQARRCGLYSDRAPGVDSGNGKGIGFINMAGGSAASPTPNPNAPRGFSFISNCYALDCGGAGIQIVQSNYGTTDTGTYDAEIINHTLVSNCIAYGNRKSGFKHGWQSDTDCNGSVLYSNCVAECNGHFGFESNETADEGKRIAYSNCHANKNGMGGFKDRGGVTAVGPQLSNCAARQNLGIGYMLLSPFGSLSNCRGENNDGDDLWVGADAADCTIDTFQSISLTDGTAGIHVHGDRCLITGGMAKDASGASATGILIASGADSTRYDNRNHAGVTTSVTDGGTNTSAGIVVPAPLTQAATIASGVVTLTGPSVKTLTLDTESSDASDDLDTISGGTATHIIVIRAANAARDVVVKDGTGNIQSAGDFTLNHTDDSITLVCDGTNWIEMARSDNAA